MENTGKIICGTAEVERIAERLRSKRSTLSFQRRLPVGAEVLQTGGAHFRVWAPKSDEVAVTVFDHVESNSPSSVIALQREAGGYHSGVVDDVRAGSLYRFKLGSGLFPDPASRFQPTGPHGPSQVVDSSTFPWTDAGWNGVKKKSLVIYEMHVGTFTREGTWQAAARQLPELAAFGITGIEVMPVADFSGRFGWGYDGVNMFAPTRLYGQPDEFRAFIDQAHALGIAVILDVVYNHFGPDGNYLHEFSDGYFTTRYECEWGGAINFDGENSGGVREFFLGNAQYWVEEFHVDGLRLDATQQIFDSSADHIIAAIVRRVREAAAGRETFIVAENEPQHSWLARSPARGGYGLDALWNDDLHHSAVVAATGDSEAYYTDYNGAPQEFISALKWGYLFQGQRYKWQKKRRGTPALDLEPGNFVAFLDNHDQVANSVRGQRLHARTTPGRYKALTTLLLLGPNLPMLFQGQEFAASGPFYYFADHEPELATLVAAGRRKFMHQFKSATCRECDAILPDPASEETFRRSVLDFSEREKHSEIYAMHRELLRLRREDPVFSRVERRGFDGAVLGAEAFVLRFFGKEEDRLIIINLGKDLRLDPAPEPLLAPPANGEWDVIFSTESVCYGGSGTQPIDSEQNWWLPGHAAVVLGPELSKDKDATIRSQD